MPHRYASLKNCLLVLLLLLAGAPAGFGQSKTKSKGKPAKGTVAVFDSALYNGLK